MTIDDARALIPPGWVECDVYAYNASDDGIRYNYIDSGQRCSIYAIPAPKPEPRRVPCGEIAVEFDNAGCLARNLNYHTDIRDFLGGHDAVANTKWTLDFDRREWVEENE